MLMNHFLVEGNLHFTLNDNLDCEDYILTNSDNEVIEVQKFSTVENFVKEVFEKFKLSFSEHRTQGFIHWNIDRTHIEVETFRSPDWDDYEEIQCIFYENVQMNLLDDKM